MPNKISEYFLPDKTLNRWFEVRGIAIIILWFNYKQIPLSIKFKEIKEQADWSMIILQGLCMKQKSSTVKKDQTWNEGALSQGLSDSLFVLHSVYSTACLSYHLSVELSLPVFTTNKLGLPRLEFEHQMHCVGHYYSIQFIHPNHRYIGTCSTMYMNVRFIFWTCSKIYLPLVLNR